LDFAELEQQALSSATTEGVVVLDSVGMVVRANAKAKSMMGLSDDEVGHSVRDPLGRSLLADTDGVPLPIELWPGLLALDGATIRDQEIGIHRDGRTTWLNTSAVPIVMADGRCGGVVVTLSDVTRLRSLEQHHEQMIRLVSHDIRNPLTSVHLNAQLLEKSLADKDMEKEQRLTASVLGAARRLDVMLQELVDSSRIRSGQLGLSLRPVAIERLIPEILARNAGTIDTSRVRLALPDRSVLVTADVTRLERVLTNLLVIALQHCPEGTEVALRVSLEAEEVRFAVAVPGRGSGRDDAPIPPTSHFGQNRLDMGFGMGLFIARMLVERHGGRLWLQNTADRGTTFHFAIPLEADKPLPAHPR
jgi:signal transduction histidine kinase